MAVGFGFAACTSGSLWQFYAAYSIMAVLGAGAGSISWARLIAGAFTRQRGLALGLALSGTGFCALLAPLYTAQLIGSYGWRGAYAGLALVPLVLALPLSLAFVPEARHGAEASVTTEPEKIALSGFTVGEALRSYRFWTLAASITVVYFAISGLIPNLAPLLIDRGLPAQTAAQITSILGVSIVVSRMVLGWLFDRYWAPLIGVATVLPAAAACIVLKLDLNVYEYLAAAALIGVATGAEIDLLSYLLARYFGLYRYARIYGWIFSAFSLSAGLAPMAFGRLYDASRSYNSSLNIAAALFVLGSLLLLTLGPYPDLPLRRRTMA